MSAVSPRRRSLRLFVALVSVGLLASVVSVAPASAQDIDSLRDRASALADKLEEVEREQSLADEAYLVTVDQLEKVRTDINATKASIDEAQARVDDAEEEASAFLVSSYMDAGSAESLVAAGTDDVNSSLNQRVLLDTLRGDREGLADELNSSRADLDDRKSDLEGQEAEVVELEGERKAARERLESAVDRQQELYDEANGELQSALEAERRRREEEAARRAAAEAAARAEAAAAAAAAAQTTTTAAAPSTTGSTGSTSTSSAPRATAPSTTSGSGGGSAGSAPAPAPAPAPPAPAPPTSSGAAGAIQAAKSMLGTPYRWGGASPGGFDCSGLIMWSWARVGVGLPHSSRAMYSATQRVSLSQIQPGDLLFYGSPIHHVSMYVGGGQVIDSPRTGLSVRIVGMGYTGRIVGVGRVR